MGFEDQERKVKSLVYRAGEAMQQNLDLRVKVPDIDYNPLKITGNGKAVAYDRGNDSILITMPLTDIECEKPVNEEILVALMEANGYDGQTVYDGEAYSDFVKLTSELPGMLGVYLPDIDEVHERKEIAEMMEDRGERVEAIMKQACREYSEWKSGFDTVLSPLLELDQEVRESIPDDFPDIEALPEGYWEEFHKIKNGYLPAIEDIVRNYGPIHEAVEEWTDYNAHQVSERAINVLEGEKTLEQAHSHRVEVDQRLDEAIEWEKDRTDISPDNSVDELYAAMSLIVDSYINGILEYNTDWHAGEILERAEKDFSVEVREKLEELLSEFSKRKGDSTERLSESIDSVAG